MSEEEKRQIEEECLLNCSKAKMIEKYIDELEESSKLSELWCNSQQENKQLKEVIEEVRKSLEDYQEYIDEAKEFYSDLEDDDVVKVSNLQLLNNQMVRNYDVLQILDKAKENK